MSVISASVDHIPVTLCILVYNSGEQLVDVFESILKQTHQNFKVKIYNNGSTDPLTNELCEEFTKDSRFSHIFRIKNVGPFRSLEQIIIGQNEGYFNLLADDMVIYPEYLAQCLRAHQSHPDLGIVYTGVDCKNEERRGVHFDQYSLMQESVFERLMSLAENQTLGTALYGMMNSRFTNVINDIWPHDNFMRLGDSMIFNKVLCVSKMQEVKMPLIFRDLTKSNLDYDARLEKIFYGGHYHVSLPFVRGVKKHYIWHLSEDSPLTVKETHALIERLIQRYQQSIFREVQRANQLLYHDAFTSWSGKTNKLNIPEVMLADLYSCASFINRMISSEHTQKLLHTIQNLITR